MHLLEPRGLHLVVARPHGPNQSCRSTTASSGRPQIHRCQTQKKRYGLLMAATHLEVALVGPPIKLAVDFDPRDMSMRIRKLMCSFCSKSVTLARKEKLHAYYTIGYY